MAEEILIEEREAQPVVEVAATTRLWKIPKVLASGYQTAHAHIESSGGEVVGMPFARYLGIDWEDFRSKGALAQFLEFLTGKQEMRSGLFVKESVPSAGEAIGTEIPAGRYVTTIHRGPYHKVGDTYRRVYDWAIENDIELADNTLENYIDDPTDVPMSDVRTQVWIAVV